ncbi:MAG: hypothetical protein OEM81_01465 [Acidimicrobiia bacterium]|nr:hypothetical protein [Acidimicrobiia bacterium]MDH3396479.1 hypothetical protein [Acidimicrobiia bacterium]
MEDRPSKRGDDEELERVGRELRERVGGEFRLAAEEDEYWAMKQARRAGVLSDIAYDAMNRGDLIEVWAGERAFRGFIQHTRNDLLVLQAHANVDVNLGSPVVLRVVEPAARQGIGVARNGPASFAARVAELEQSGTVCDFIVPFSRAAVQGRVAIRATDHVIVDCADGQEWVVPLKWLTAVVSG